MHYLFLCRFCIVTVHTLSELYAVSDIRAVSGRPVLLSFPSLLTQQLRVIFGLLRITPSPLLISLTALQGLIVCEQ